jgi:hypothetical protein
VQSGVGIVSNARIIVVVLRVRFVRVIHVERRSFLNKNMFFLLKRHFRPSRKAECLKVYDRNKQVWLRTEEKSHSLANSGMAQK